MRNAGSRLGALHSNWTVVDAAALIMRGVLGYVFVAHGAQKLFGWFGGGGIDGTTAFFTSLKIPAPKLMAIASGLVEFFGGIAIIVGLLTVAASLALIVDMVGAIATFNHAHGFFVESPDGGWELNFVLIGLLAALALVGAGAWSIDHTIGLARARGTDTAALPRRDYSRLAR
ncbi:MAG: putative oxidoreductase [Cryptosporangiaceae bacterium]|jgi:putative oxidoreductase|nr:putative oxidoreductase [Cryptosporangiaceae bacterium]